MFLGMENLNFKANIAIKMCFDSFYSFWGVNRGQILGIKNIFRCFSPQIIHSIILVLLTNINKASQSQD